MSEPQLVANFGKRILALHPELMHHPKLLCLILSLCLGLQRSEKPWHELVHPKYFFAALDHHGVASP